MRLRETYRKVIGRKNSHVWWNMGPFLMDSGTGNILVFNNWDRSSKEKKNKKEIVEYINYLDGTLILPEFPRIEMDFDASDTISIEVYNSGRYGK